MLHGGQGWGWGASPGVGGAGVGAELGSCANISCVDNTKNCIKIAMSMLHLYFVLNEVYKFRARAVTVSDRLSQRKYQKII